MNNPSETNMLVKLDHFLKFRGEHSFKKISEHPPPIRDGYRWVAGSSHDSQVPGLSPSKSQAVSSMVVTGNTAKGFASPKFFQTKHETGKLTCVLKKDQFNTTYIFQPCIFRGHVSVQRCISKCFNDPPKNVGDQPHN